MFFCFFILIFLPIGARQISSGACRASLRERRELLRALDENEVCILHHQVVQTCRESMAVVIREFQQKHDLFQQYKCRHHGDRRYALMGVLRTVYEMANSQELGVIFQVFDTLSRCLVSLSQWYI